MLAEGGLAGVVVGRCCPGGGRGADTAQVHPWYPGLGSVRFVTRVQTFWFVYTYQKQGEKKVFSTIAYAWKRAVCAGFFFFFFFTFVGLLSPEKLFLWHTNVYDYDVKISLGCVYSAAWSKASASSGIPPSSFTACNPALLIWFGSPSFPTLPSHCSGLWPGLSSQLSPSSLSFSISATVFKHFHLKSLHAHKMYRRLSKSFCLWLFSLLMFP